MTKGADNPTPQMPRHVAIIMDGNGRWASNLGRPRFAGHRAGVKSARQVVESCAQAGVETLTLFAFSSENWQRPAEEVNALMRLFIEVLQREVSALHKNGIRLQFIGARENLPEILQKRIEAAETRTAGNIRMTLILAVSFGGRWDIVQAARRIAGKVRAGEMEIEDIDEQSFSRHTSLAACDDPDLLIRTGGEKRVSNFLLWDLAYSEIYFTDTLWPNYGNDDLTAAMEFFSQRQRRFGRVGDRKEVSAD